MNIRFETLALTCKQSKEVIDFSSRLSLFYGKMSSGKSTIARLIDYCLGGDLQRTTAIDKELISVQLVATIEQYSVILERPSSGSDQVQVTWTTKDGLYGSLLAPTGFSQTPIWEGKICNLSDLLFHFLGIEPLRIPKSAQSSEQQPVRLSFRNFMWYCYLQQNLLDSSFYWLKTEYRQRNSRYVLDYIVGAYSDKLSAIKTEIGQIKEEKSKKKTEVESIRPFLEKFGYNSEDSLLKEIKVEEEKLAQVYSELAQMKNGFTGETHFVDKQREKLRSLERDLSDREVALDDIRRRIIEQTSLKAELIATKFKLVRSVSAENILDGVKFEICPSCGAKIEASVDTDVDTCHLCKQMHPQQSEVNETKADIVKLDLDARIFELEESINRQTKEQEKQKHDYSELRAEKNSMDAELAEALKIYDSNFLAASRQIEHQIAASEEKIQNLRKLARMPKAVNSLQDEIIMLDAKEQRLNLEFEREKATFITAEELIKEIESSYLNALISIGLQGVHEDDRVEIDRNTWIPYILEHGSKEHVWDFFNAGSGGKMTILNVCYALAIHKVAAERKLPLPNFLIIDSPMKNVGKGVNQEVFEAFYKYLYNLALGPLAETQLIILETDYVQPPDELPKMVRKMTPDDPDFPPLIRYYRGA
ncbi:MAG: hypothetical protein ABSA79_09095 [Candidatus Bathyarchaeia archaeon]|jgi:hypothetical protein